jgi:hypothetical protein
MGSVRFKVVQKDGHQLVEEIHKVVVYTFRMSDVEDPDLWAGQSLYDWQISDQGKFVMENSVETPSWHREIDQYSMGWKYAIVAELEMKKLSEFYLKWGKSNGNI